MPITVVTSGVSASQLQVHLSPLAELGAMLHAIIRADHHSRSRTIQHRAHADSEPGLVAMTRRFAPLYGALRARFFLPLDVPTGGESDLAKGIARIGRLSVPEFVAMCAEPISEQARDVDHDVLLDDPAARAVFLKRVERISIARTEVAHDLLDDPERVRAQVQEFLAAAAERWLSDEWREHRPLLATEATQRRAELSRYGLDVLARISPTALRYRDPDRVVYDKVNHAIVTVHDRPVVLVPSYHTSMHLIIKHDAGWPIVIQYEAAAPRRTSYVDVTRRIAALQDPARMRICRFIQRQPRSTSDLSLSTGLATPQVSRHLRALREAGLVTSTRQGKVVYYSLDVDAVRRLGDDIFVSLLR